MYVPAPEVVKEEPQMQILQPAMSQNPNMRASHLLTYICVSQIYDKGFVKYDVELH